LDLYLKPSIKIEPLIWQWYAWPYLIPPLTAACNIVERHLKIMQSYIQNPEIHAQAVMDPRLLGGPFIDLDGQKIDEIKALIDKTNNDCAEYIHLASSFKELDRTLLTETQGDSLEDFYKRIPTPLKGYVELVYSLNSHPSIRLIEQLIYNKYYSDKHQSIAISESKQDFRKFALSTPRLDQNEEVYLNIPFSDTRLDTLFKMKEYSQDFSKLNALFDISSNKKMLFESFFTEESPPLSKDREYNGNGVRIRYLGHACILIQTKKVSILIDPVISYTTQNDIPRYTYMDLPNHIDYVIITHNHQDHLMFETLLQLRYKIGHIIFPANHNGALEDPSIKLILKHVGFSNTIELKEFDTISLADGVIIALPFLGEHSDLNIQSKLSYCIQLNSHKFLFAADSNNLDTYLYNHIFNFIGPIDMLFLGMECDGAPLSWLYGPLLTQPLKRTFDKNRSLSGSNFDKAWMIVEKSGCKKAYVYAMGQEPWLNYIMALKYSESSVQIIESNKFVQACKENGIESERLFGQKEWLITE